MVMRNNEISVEQLTLIITHRCNLKCLHCLRGNSEKVDMSDEIMNKIFKNIKHVECLQISGGEPLLTLNVLANLFRCVVENKVVVEQCTLVTNGTLYNKKFEDIMVDFNDYINRTMKKNLSSISVAFKVSDDVFHSEQIDKHGLKEVYYKNIKDCFNSKFFYGIIGNSQNLFLQGRVNSSFVEDSSLFGIPIFDGGIIRARNRGVDYYGPQVLIDALGNVCSSSDFSYDNIKEQYRLGNVLENSLFEILSLNSTVVPYRKFQEEKVYARLRHYGKI